MNADDDPDWEEEARSAEAEARRAEFRENLATSLRRIQKSHPLDVTNLPPRTRLVVTTFSEIDDPVEFTIIDPECCKVLVKDGRDFREPSEGILLGCEDNQAITSGTHYPCKRVLLPGKLKRLCWPIFELAGKKFDAGADTIMRIAIFRAGETEPLFTLWQDD